MNLLGLQALDQARRHPPGTGGLRKLGHLLIGKNRLGLAQDVSGVVVRHDVGRHRRLELALAPEHDHRMELVLG